MSGIAERWKVLSGSDNWEGLLDPFDSDLRRYLIHYATMVGPAVDAFINEKASNNKGLSRYAPENLLAKSGVVKGNPFKYEVTKYFYSTSSLNIPGVEYTVTPEPLDAAVKKETNWIGYVAVATDEGKAALGRRDILIVWRGTKTLLEQIANFTFSFIKAPKIFGEDSDPLVHRGWYDMYTTSNQDSVLKEKSARDQIREEVERLIELYKEDEVSITVAGHSLGSSMATINAVDLAVNPINNNKDVLVTSFVYGSPKVGDENFGKAFSNQPNLRGMRISDVHDLITEVPKSGPKDGTLLPFIPYVDVGVGLMIESKKSDYLKPDIKDLYTHDLMLYMHGIDGYQGPQGKFERQGYFDLAQVNKYQGALKDEYRMPGGWLSVKDNGMVQQEDGTYILDDREPYEPF